MKLPAYLGFLSLSLFCLPLSTYADFELSGPVQVTFENQQNLTLSIQEASSSTNMVTLSNDGTFAFPISTQVPLIYRIDHTQSWPSRTADPQTQATLFKQRVEDNNLYMELWRGTPFTADAQMIQSWNITGSSTGQISATFPSSGSYFFIAYFPQGFYRNPQSACPNDTNWQIDCAEPYTLDQLRSYFNSSLISTSSEPFPYMPDAFGGVQFTVTAATSTDSSKKSSNVLFIPGTLTSRLYMKSTDGSERELWEPRSDLDIPELAINTDGTSRQEIYTRDLIDQLYSNEPFYHGALHLALKKDTDVYGTFETFMDGLVARHLINDWHAYPYDWRYDVRDIVSDGTLVGTGTTSPSRIYLQDVVQELASTSATGKVTIIAHSNGGLIAKALAIDLAEKNKLGLIDRIIMVGTPQLGTPKSITDLLHGDEFTQLGGLLMYSTTVRDAEATMPGAYDLLPSTGYFVHSQKPVASFDTEPPASEFRNTIGAVIDSFSKLSSFLSDAFHLDAGVGLSGSTKTPIPLSEALLEKAEATHKVLDTWTPPEGLAVTAIAGWGQLTPYEESYTGASGLNCDRTNFFIPVACSLLPQLESRNLSSEDGDNTVVAESAIGDISNALYVNLKDIFKDTGIQTDHSSLLASAPVQSTLKEILTSAPIDSQYVVKSIPTSGLDPLVIISAHSPTNLLATDPKGNETGTVAVPELHGIYFEKEDIPGSSVQVIGEEKYLYLPQGIPFKVSMNGYDTGTTTIDIESMDSEGSTTLLQEFPDIPTTASTTAVFTIAANESVTSDLPELTSHTTSVTPKSISPYSLPTSEKESSQRQVPPLKTMIFSTSMIDLLEKVIDPISHVPELIKGIITITTTGSSWVMHSTLFISFIRNPI